MKKIKIYQNKLSKLVKISKKKFNDYFIKHSNNVKKHMEGY